MGCKCFGDQDGGNPPCEQWSPLPDWHGVRCECGHKRDCHTSAAIAAGEGR